MARRPSCPSKAAVLTLALGLFTGTVGAQLRLDPGTVVKGGVVTEISVSLSDTSASYHPLSRFPLLLYRPEGDSTLLMTDAAGLVTTVLPVADYRLVSVRPAQWHGGLISWNVILHVRPGIGIAELQAGNGTMEATQSPLASVSNLPPAPSAARSELAAGPALAPADAAAPRQSMRPYTPGPKDPAVGALLSFLIVGGGQVYNGQVGKGVGLFTLSLGSLVIGAAASSAAECDYYDGCSDANYAPLFIGASVAVATWIYSMIDGASGASRFNRRMGYAQSGRMSPFVSRENAGRTNAGVRVAIH